MMCSRGDSPRWRRGPGRRPGAGKPVSGCPDPVYCPQSCYLCQFLGDPTSPCGGQGGKQFTWPRCLEAWGPRGRKSPARLCGRTRAPRLCLPSRPSPSSTGATSEAAFWPKGAPLRREPLGCRGTREMWTKRTPRLTQVLAYEALASWKAAGGTAGSWGDPPSVPCPTLTPAGRAAKLPLFLAPLLVL